MSPSDLPVLDRRLDRSRTPSGHQVLYIVSFMFTSRSLTSPEEVPGPHLVHFLSRERGLVSRDDGYTVFYVFFFFFGYFDCRTPVVRNHGG